MAIFLTLDLDEEISTSCQQSKTLKLNQYIYLVDFYPAFSQTAQEIAHSPHSFNFPRNEILC